MADVTFVHCTPDAERLTEVWNPVVGYEGLYEISNTGLVRSLDRYFVLNSGKRYKRKGKILRFNVKTGKRPYLRVKLCKDNKATLLLVSRLVLEAFVSVPKPGEQACHIDGDVRNNKLSNLRWDTSKGNHADRKFHGTWPAGANNGRAMLTEVDVSIIRRSEESRQSLSVKYGISSKYISNIRSRITWKHVA